MSTQPRGVAGRQGGEALDSMVRNVAAIVAERRLAGARHAAPDLGDVEVVGGPDGGARGHRDDVASQAGRAGRGDATSGGGRSRRRPRWSAAGPAPLMATVVAKENQPVPRSSTVVLAGGVAARRRPRRDSARCLAPKRCLPRGDDDEGCEQRANAVPSPSCSWAPTASGCPRSQAGGPCSQAKPAR